MLSRYQNLNLKSIDPINGLFRARCERSRRSTDTTAYLNIYTINLRVQRVSFHIPVTNTIVNNVELPLPSHIDSAVIFLKD